MADNDFAGLFFRVFFILKNPGEWIGEDRQRFPKIYAVGCLIVPRFLGIPLKFDAHSLTIIASAGIDQDFAPGRFLYIGTTQIGARWC